MGNHAWRLLAGTAALVVVMSGCGSSPSPTPSAKVVSLPGLESTSPCGQPRTDFRASNATLTREYASQVLETFPQPPGATRLSSAPVTSLKNAPGTEMSSNLVTATGWWKAQGDALSAQSYLNAHVPKDLQSSGSEGPATLMSSGTEGPFTVMFSHADTRFATAIQVLATFAPLGHGVAERVDIQAIYWPPCPDIGALIKNPTGATMVIERPDAATRRGAINHSQAQALLAILKTLPPIAPSLRNCPAEFPNDSDAIAFRTASGVVVVTDEMSGCGGITISGHPNVSLSDVNGVFDAEVRKLLT